MIFFLLTWCFGKGLPAQAQDQQKKAVAYQLKFSPLALGDPNTPVLQLGPQVNYKRIAFSVEFGVPFDALTRTATEGRDSLFLDQRHYKVRTEVKYFLGRGKASTFASLNPYLSAEGFWVPRSFRRYNELLETAEGSYRFAYSDMSRNVLGGCIKTGLEPVIYKRWVLDMFWGLGIRQVRVTHQAVGLTPEHQGWVPVFFFKVNRVDRREGTFYRPHLAAGFKVGFVLR